uniref:Radical SAM core domain-containing protein n=1 Tax=Amphimedon queenslandica TaxID=400682 RepID=A0A1X7UGM4_AMPQE
MSFVSNVGKALGIPFGYGVYVHWPYCSQLCSYCNFNKYRQPTENEDYWKKFEDCLEIELKSLLESSNYPRVTSVYFGGGTPSLAPPGTIKRTLDCIGIDETVEVTLEVNPHPSVLDKLSLFRDAGVNRLSLGIQSLNDGTLQLIKRDHLSQDALNVLSTACELMPTGRKRSRISIDLMFGLPGQTMKEWIDHLTYIISNYPIGHASLYQLTLEKGTPLMKAVKKILEARLFNQYEVSNYALEGSQSIHSLNYWLGGNYLGIGPGAHSRYQTNDSHSWTSSINALTPRQWMNAVQEKGNSMKLVKRLTPRERFNEILVTSLRTQYGLQREHCEAFNINFDELIHLLNEHHPELFTGDLLKYSTTKISATTKGVAVLDAVLTDLLAPIDNNYYHAYK